MLNKYEIISRISLSFVFFRDNKTILYVRLWRLYPPISWLLSTDWAPPTSSWAVSAPGWPLVSSSSGRVSSLHNLNSRNMSVRKKSGTRSLFTQSKVRLCSESLTLADERCGLTLWLRCWLLWCCCCCCCCCCLLKSSEEEEKSVGAKLMFLGKRSICTSGSSSLGAPPFDWVESFGWASRNKRISSKTPT